VIEVVTLWRRGVPALGRSAEHRLQGSSAPRSGGSTRRSFPGVRRSVGDQVGRGLLRGAADRRADRVGLAGTPNASVAPPILSGQVGRGPGHEGRRGDRSAPGSTSLASRSCAGGARASFTGRGRTPPSCVTSSSVPWPPGS